MAWLANLISLVCCFISGWGPGWTRSLRVSSNISDISWRRKLQGISKNRWEPSLIDNPGAEIVSDPSASCEQVGEVLILSKGRFFPTIWSFLGNFKGPGLHDFKAFCFSQELGLDNRQNNWRQTPIRDRCLEKHISSTVFDACQQMRGAPVNGKCTTSFLERHCSNSTGGVSLIFVTRWTFGLLNLCNKSRLGSRNYE